MRILISLMLVLVSAALQFQAIGAWRWSPDFLLAALVVLAFFAGMRELLALLAVTVWLINWQPGLSIDLALFIALPLLAWSIRTFLPWQAWISVLGTTGATITAFYGTLHHSAKIITPVFFADVVLSIGYAALVFLLYFGVLGYPWADRRRLFT